MGCRGSKDANYARGSRTGGAAPVTVTAGAEGDFKVHLERSADEPFGLSIALLSDNMILVELVWTVGLVPAWNKRNLSTPEVQVRPGDIIIGVNGIFGNTDDMLRELKTADIILTVKRADAESPCSSLSARKVPDEAWMPSPIVTKIEPARAQRATDLASCRTIGSTLGGTAGGTAGEDEVFDKVVRTAGPASPSGPTLKRGEQERAPTSRLIDELTVEMDDDAEYEGAACDWHRCSKNARC